MKTLAMVLFTITMATGCTVNGKSMFGTGPQSPTSARAATAAPAPPSEAPMIATPAQHRQEVGDFVVRLERLVGVRPQWDAFEHKQCTRDYQKLVAQGVAPTTTVTVKGRTGTLEAFEREICSDPVANRDRQEDQDAAARRAARKAEQDRRDGKTP